MTGREAVITGVGLVTPLGVGVGESWANLLALKTGITRHSQAGMPNCLQFFAPAPEFDLAPSIPSGLAAQMKFLNRGARLGFAAAVEAMEGSGLKTTDTSPARRAVYVASGDFTKVGYDFLYPATKEASASAFQAIDPLTLNQAALTEVNPFFLLESIHNNLFSFLSAYFEFRGPNTSLASLSPYGSQALELASRSIEEKRADVALAVSYGSWINEIPLFELEGLGLLSKCQSGVSSFRPFDRLRDGFIPGEGGAAIVLESAESAHNRQAKIWGTVKGCGNCVEYLPGKGLSIPPAVTHRSLSMALEEAGCEAKDLAFICGHGSGTQKGDRSELSSFLELTAAHNAPVPVCGLKAYSGHMGAASDLAEIIWSIKAVEHRIIPATLNFGSTEKEFSAVPIASRHQSTAEKVFVSSSYGLAGQSSAVVIAL